MAAAGYSLRESSVFALSVELEQCSHIFVASCGLDDKVACMLKVGAR